MHDEIVIEHSVLYSFRDIIESNCVIYSRL